MKKKEKLKKLFDPKKKLYWMQKNGKYWDIGVSDLGNIMECGVTKSDAKEMFLERLIIEHVELIRWIGKIYGAYAGFSGSELLDSGEPKDGK